MSVASAAPTKWLHCNVCAKQPQLNNDVPADLDSLHMTNCGHVFCGHCLSNTADDAWQNISNLLLYHSKLIFFKYI